MDCRIFKPEQWNNENQTSGETLHENKTNWLSHSYQTRPTASSTVLYPCSNRLKTWKWNEWLPWDQKKTMLTVRETWYDCPFSQHPNGQHSWDHMPLSFMRRDMRAHWLICPPCLGHPPSHHPGWCTVTRHAVRLHWRGQMSGSRTSDMSSCWGNLNFPPFCCLKNFTVSIAVLMSFAT